MSLYFRSAEKEYLYTNTPAFTGYPIAVSLFFRLDDINPHYIPPQTLFCLNNNNGTATKEIRCASEGPIRAINGNIEASTIGGSLGNWSEETWIHTAAVFANTDDLRILKNGLYKGTNPSGATVDIPTFTMIGSDAAVSGNFLTGQLAEVAVWDLSSWPGTTNAAKADSFEKIIPALSSGICPTWFKNGLIAYWPMGGRNVSVII